MILPNVCAEPVNAHLAVRVHRRVEVRTASAALDGRRLTMLFYFRNGGDAYREQRWRSQSFVDGILMDANAYEGFRYLTEGEMRPGFSYGIKYQTRSATAPAAAPRRRPPLRPSPSGHG